MGTNYDEQIKLYIQLNLSWDIKRMLLINKANITVSDLVREDTINNLLVFILFGLKEPNLQRAMDIIEGWVEFFGEYKSLKSLIIIDLKEKYKFIKEKDKDDIVSVFDRKIDTECKELTHEEILKIEKNNLEHVLKVYMKSGYSYEQALEMDMSNYEFFNDYVLEKRDQFRADLHKLSYWIAVGINNPKEFDKTVDEIRLKPLTREESIEQIKNDTKAFYKEMNKEDD